MKVQLKTYAPASMLSKLPENKSAQMVPVKQNVLPEVSSVRYTVERMAENMSPESYIQAKSYLSAIELDNMYKQLDEMM